jgi:hypothetical protein
MTGTPLEIASRHTAFAKSCAMRSTLLSAIHAHGRVMEAALDDTFSPDFPSVWCIGYGARRSKSLRSLMVDADRATGGRDSDSPSNFRIQRRALRAAADTRRWADEMR